MKSAISTFVDTRFSPDLAALNPLRKVPVLEDSNGIEATAPFFEPGAILLYLADTYGVSLAEMGPSSHAAIRWLMVQMAWVAPTLGQYSHFPVQPAKPQDEGSSRNR